MPTVPTCHPDRKHYGKSLCRLCWDAKWRAEHPDYGREKTRLSRQRRAEGLTQPRIPRRVPDCHPDQKHYGKGLCKRCYDAQQQKEHPEWGQRKSARYRERHPDKVQQAQISWKIRNPDKVTADQKRQRMRRYGITLEDRENMLKVQDNKCAACQAVLTPDNINVDHKHVEGFEDLSFEEKRRHVRGLPCDGCNKALGFANDDIDRFLRLINYLRSPPGVPDYSSTLLPQSPISNGFNGPTKVCQGLTRAKETMDLVIV